MKNILFKLKRYFYKILCVFSCVCFLFSFTFINSFALEDNTPDLKLQSPTGYVFEFGQAQFLNNSNSNVYYATTDPVSNNTDGHYGFRVLLTGDYDNNTRMCTLRVTLPNAMQRNGRFRLTIKANGENIDSTWALPKLNSIRSNNNSFYTGYYLDSSQNDTQVIDFIGELPEVFYIVTWYNYYYDAGRLVNIYFDFDWIPTFSYTPIDAGYADEESAINISKNDLNSSLTFLNSNAELTARMRFASLAIGDVFNKFMSFLPVSFMRLIYISLALGVAGFVFAIVQIIQKE